MFEPLLLGEVGSLSKSLQIPPAILGFRVQMVFRKVGPDNVHSGGGVMAIRAEPSKQNYTVKSVENVVLGSDVQARIFTLAPGEVWTPQN